MFIFKKIFLVLVGVDPRVPRLGGEVVSHYTTNARQKYLNKCRQYVVPGSRLGAHLP